MDDLDRELKGVQLLRERLALEKELRASKRRAKTIAAASAGAMATTAVVGRAGRSFTHAARFVGRWWSVVVLAGMFAGLLGAGAGFLVASGAEQRVAAEYEKQRANFVDPICAAKDAIPHIDNVGRIGSARGDCEDEARIAFQRQWEARKSR